MICTKCGEQIAFGIACACGGHKVSEPTVKPFREWLADIENIDLFKQRIATLENAYANTANEVEQTLAQALGGYPWYKDDPKNFPGATEQNGVCVGDHTPETLAREAARCILGQKQELADRASRILGLEIRNRELEDELQVAGEEIGDWQNERNYAQGNADDMEAKVVVLEAARARLAKALVEIDAELGEGRTDDLLRRIATSGTADPQPRLALLARAALAADDSKAAERLRTLEELYLEELYKEALKITQHPTASYHYRQICACPFCAAIRAVEAS